MIRGLTIALTIAVLSAAPSSASVSIAEQYMPNPVLVGEARLKFLFWKIYDAELYAPNGNWSETKPFALTFTYLRKATSKQISKRMVKELRGQGFEDEAILDSWYQISLQIFPDVDKGTQITGVRDKYGHAQFFLNDQPIGTVEDPLFTDWFFRIWLGKKTSVPKFRSHLLGKETS